MHELRKLWLVAIFVGTGFIGWGQTNVERVITLEECIRIALEENLDVRIDRRAWGLRP
jgi:hypothetical protein